MDFLKYLNEKNIVLFDGAMGTMIYNKGIYINNCYDELNVSNPDMIIGIHREYIQSGADVIETNTFGANKYKLKAFNLEKKVQEINYKGAKLAKKASEGRIFIGGAMGPLGIKIEPWGSTSREEAREAFSEQAEALLDGGVDLIVIETFTDISEIEQAIKAVKAIDKDIPVIAMMTVGIDGTSLYGTTPEIFTKRIDEWNADIIGLNCGEGPKVLLDTSMKMLKCTNKPLCLMPEAGRPRNVAGRNIYMCSPEYIAEYAKRYINSGIRLIGGCCGTTPEHTRQMAKAVRSLSKSVNIVKPIIDKAAICQEPVREREEIPMGEKSSFADKISKEQFVISIEIVPPRGTKIKTMLKTAKKLKEFKIDAFNIPDGPRASARMSALATAILLQNETGIDAVLHYTCRDRNILGMQSDMLGAYVLGIKNLLLITGDPPKMGTYPDATAVFDIDSIGLTNMVKTLNKGLDLGKNSIGRPTGFCIGIGANPGAINLDFELERFFWKVDAGAEYAITQPVFDIDLLFNFLEKIEKRNIKIPVLAGVWPLTSQANADFMRNEIPGAWVPDDLYDRISKACSKEDALKIGIDISIEIIDKIKKYVQGVQLSIIGSKTQNISRILESI